MDLVDEVDYHCCVFCDNFFPSDYELLKHVNEQHQGIVDWSSKNKNETMEYIQTTFIEEENINESDDYLEEFHHKSPPLKVLPPQYH